MVKLVFVILITVWQPVGRVIYFYHTELKEIPRRQWGHAIWAHRFDILEKGFLGFFTLHYHKKWNGKREKKVTKSAGIVRELNIAVNE